MTSKKRRVEKLETELTPKQAVLLWMQEAHSYDTMEQYCRSLKPGPDSAWPLAMLPEKVSRAVEQAMKGRPREEIARQARLAVRDVVFLFHLHQKVNAKIMEEDRHYATKALLLSTQMDALRRERSLRDQMTWNWVRFGMKLPYPLDPETAAAVDAAQRNWVVTWEHLDEGEELCQWVSDSFVAEGKTALPEHACRLVQDSDGEGDNNALLQEEARAAFEDEAEFQKFIAGEDYSYGLADVTDAEYEARYDGLMEAMKGGVQPGVVAELPTVPHMFLKDAPLVDGEWIDQCVVAMAEWGARLAQQGFAVEDPDDNHPLAWSRITDPEDGTEAGAEVLAKVWRETRKRLERFPGRTREIDGRPYLSFTGYLKWRGRWAKGDLKSGLRQGLAVSRWNQWVEEHCGEDVAVLAGVKLGPLRCYTEGYQYHVSQDAEDAAKQIHRRKTFLDSLRDFDSNGKVEQRFKRHVGEWKQMADDFLLELYALRGAIDSISRRYFDCQEILFPAVAEWFVHLVGCVEKLVDWYNGDLAARVGRQEGVLDGADGGSHDIGFAISPEDIAKKSQAPVVAQVAYLVDMAKAEALDLLGETEQAAALVERHV